MKAKKKLLPEGFDGCLREIILEVKVVIINSRMKLGQFDGFSNNVNIGHSDFFVCGYNLHRPS